MNLRGEVARVLIHRVNTKQPVHPLWFEIADLKSESVDANIGALGANIKPTYELYGSVFDHTKIIFTPTSACLLFNRFDVLSKLLDNPIVFRLERQCLRRIHLKSPYNLDRAESAWALMPANPVRLAMREYSSARHTNWYEYFERTILPMMGRLLALFQGISALNVILQRCMDTIMNHFGAESVVGRREQLFNKLALEADEFASRFRLKVPLPPVLDVLVASMSDVAISDATRTGGRKFLSQVYERLCLSNGTTTKRIRWMREHFRAVMKHMDKRVHPYMASLLTADKRRTKFVPATLGGAFVLRRAECVFEPVSDKYVRVVFSVETDAPDYCFSVILSHDDLHRTLGGQAEFVFVKHGFRATDKSPPKLIEACVPYHNVVPRLRFGLDRSDGVLLRHSVIGRQHGDDVTANLHLLKRRQCRRNKQPHSVPFAATCLLNRDQLQTAFARAFATFSPEQRYVFYCVFWNIHTELVKDSANASVFVTTPRLKAFVEALIHRVTDWERFPGVCTPKNIRHLLPSGVSNTKRGRLISAFWARWSPLSLSPPTRVYFSFAIPGPPVNPFVTISSMCTSISQLAQTAATSSALTFMLRFVSRANLAMEPVYASYGGILRFLYSAGTHPTIRRLAWQSLIASRFSNAHEARELVSTVPVFTAADQATLDTVDFQTSLRLIAHENDAHQYRTIEVVRQDRTFVQNAPILCNTVTNPFEYEVVFAGEEGRGPSVFVEALLMMWQAAVREKLMCVYSEDGGMCITPALPASETWRLYNLGFISGLLLCRGAYLPFTLHSGLWRVLCLPADGFQTQSLCPYFNERVAERRRQLCAMTPDEYRTAFVDLVPDLEFKSHEEVIETLCLPTNASMSAFKIGFDICMARISIRSMDASTLNRMFCEPEQIRVTVRSFVQAFKSRDSVRDRVFLRALESLAPEQLLQLVKFITGTERLPLLCAGEEPITVTWNHSVAGAMPIAQNCMNALLLPSGAEKDTASVLSAIRPVLEFETDYGYA